MSDIVKVSEEGPVTVIQINRPDKGNAISRQVAIDLQAAFAAFDASDQRVAVLTSAGDKHFSAGADVTDLPELWRCVPTLGIATEKPVIAATTGWVVGGAVVIVMMADLCIASETTKFSYPEAKLGFTGGAIAGLAARIPHKIAMEMIMMGRPMTAERAWQAGFVNKVVPVGQHIAEAVAWGQELAGYAPLVLKTIKRFVVQSVLPRGPSELMALAQQDLAAVRESEDGAEGRAAFKEKRKPNFKGR
ncbi:MAG: enoyl-CoA hydratase [Alphaproteobacteria bacterium]|nr:enoyl-CoA hydratase [Alphaproteobacteria bacterium]